jgi:hypothetical protein
MMGGMRIRFTIHNILYVMLIVALCGAWFADHRRMVQQVAEMVEDLQEAKGEINRLNGNSQYESVLRSLPQAIPYTALSPADNLPSLKLSPKYSIPKMRGGITGNNNQNSQN